MEIWTDGACLPNPGLGGWGWHRSDGKSACGGEEATTNNRMEMTAILEALRELPDGAHATVYSDSQYCVKGLTVWRSGWRRKGWMNKTGDMPNRDLWLQLEEEMIRCCAEIRWVKGHAGDPGNEKADQLADFGRRTAITAELQRAGYQ
jgi:ribonuclease HI